MLGECFGFQERKVVLFLFIFLLLRKHAGVNSSWTIKPCFSLFCTYSREVSEILVLASSLHMSEFQVLSFSFTKWNGRNYLRRTLESKMLWIFHRTVAGGNGWDKRLSCALGSPHFNYTSATSSLSASVPPLQYGDNNTYRHYRVVVRLTAR